MSDAAALPDVQGDVNATSVKLYAQNTATVFLQKDATLYLPILCSYFLYSRFFRKNAKFRGDSFNFFTFFSFNLHSS